MQRDGEAVRQTLTAVWRGMRHLRKYGKRENDLEEVEQDGGGCVHRADTSVCPYIGIIASQIPRHTDEIVGADRCVRPKPKVRIHTKG